MMSPDKPSCRHVTPRDGCFGPKGAEGQFRGQNLEDTEIVDEV